MSLPASHDPVDVAAVWKKIFADLKAMTPAQKAQTLVDAGILTAKGNVRKPYRNAIVPIEKKQTARAGNRSKRKSALPVAAKGV